MRLQNWYDAGWRDPRRIDVDTSTRSILHSGEGIVLAPHCQIGNWNLAHEVICSAFTKDTARSALAVNSVPIQERSGIGTCVGNAISGIVLVCDWKLRMCIEVEVQVQRCGFPTQVG
jgi:hypothetical protein